MTGTLLGSVPIAAGPQYICWPGGFTAYVTTRQGTIVAVDLSSRKVIRTLLSGGPFGTMDYDATTGEVYVPDETRNQLDVLIPVTANTTVTPREPVRVFHLNGSPQSIAITSDGTLGFVALANGQVVMLDVPGRKVIASFAVGGTPHFIITGTYPPKTSTAFPPQPTGPQASSSIPLSLLLLAVVLAGLLLLGALWFFWEISGSDLPVSVLLASAARLRSGERDRACLNLLSLSEPSKLRFKRRCGSGGAGAEW